MSALKYVDVAEVPKIFNRLRSSFRKGVNATVEQRQNNIRMVIKMLKENQGAFVKALYEDLHKCEYEACFMEVNLIVSEGYELIDQLPSLVKPRAFGLMQKPLANAGDKVEMVANPLGVVLIIGAWNYPLQVSLVPVLGALAAGCTVVLKPSEVASASAQLMADLLPKYVSEDVLTVCNGAIAETTALLAQPFNHYFYTGSGVVGKIVMAAAAKHLSSVTLELGGKSPVYIDEGIDLETAAKRILWGRFMNAGQTCIAPDYILIKKNKIDALVAQFQKARDQFLGKDPKQSKDYARIINAAHFKRVTDLMSGGRIVVGGETDASENFIAPTVLVDVKLDHPLMTTEIFGPLLPIIPCESPEEAVNFICDRDKPLALYLFSNTASTVSMFRDRVPAGGMTVNDVIMHAGCPCLPFGGVGPSGMGAYHGDHSFECFTHRKPVLSKSMGMEAMNKVRYPPYDMANLRMLTRLLLKTKESNPVTKYITVAVVFAVTSALLYVYVIKPRV
eukprot:PhF_6_TR33654/c0_g1_i2/m.49233/K00128/ALDH; aldehyde dehydrogenase (NAD+)